MVKKFDSPAGWAPPGAQFQDRGVVSRPLAGMLFGLIVTPIGIVFAAKGGVDTQSWVTTGAVGGHGTATLELLGGSLLLLLAAATAAFSPIGTIVASLVWGLVPGVLYLLFPNDTLRWIGDLPFTDDSTQAALHAWVSYGFAFISGMLLLGAGMVGVLRR